MATQPGYYRDVLFSTTAAGNLAAWFSALVPRWPGWNYETGAGFNDGRVGAVMLRNGADAIGIVRMLQEDFDDLVSRGPPGALFDVYAQADPYADVSGIPADAADFREQVLRRRSVYWKVRSDAAKVARVREFWPRDQVLYDGDGNAVGIRQAGLLFASFGDGWGDPAGEAEA